MGLRARGRFTLFLATVLTACTGPADVPAWERIDLPGASGVELHAAADCDGLWYVAGALRDTGGRTRPAAWTSTDAVTWQPVRFSPLPTSQYGPQNVISAVACAAGRVAMLGSAPGGAHGNPRVSTWRRLPDGRMAENAAPFETYGGDTAVDVAHLSAGPDGFAMAGNRSTGAAAWLSPDGTGYTLFENAPGLASDASGRTVARDAVALPDGRWALVGGRDDRAAAWFSRDGRRWESADPPAAGADWTELQRAVRVGDDVVAAGPRGTTFATWRLRGGAWTELGTFGGAPTGVRSLTATGDHLLAVAGGLWISADGADWQSRAVPETPVAATGRDRTLLVVTAGAAWRSTF
ncbi:hypothetical protein [Actinoplanes aureus]|uniref:Uncharacterized protein n=1 Tax=Actinoplanes aureus TaxID=2792083 RepID=A0A931G878_9ACTN|nr:hypothetical protein [Actinoplanes aureus]MBG0568979.1 hypothetical protein [Actinoplanes aureus]